MANATAELAQARAARIAGSMYLIGMATAIFGEAFVRDSLIVSGNATRTAQNIIESELLYRVGIATDLFTFASVVVLIWALYVLLRPVNKDLVLLAVFFRVVEVATHFVATINSLVVLRFLTGGDYLATFGTSQLHTLARVAIGTQADGVSIGFILLGLGSTVFAYLLVKSRYVPRALAMWGVFSSLLITAAAFWDIVSPSTAGVPQLSSYVAMFIYEVTLGLWLLLKGVNIRSISASAA